MENNKFINKDSAILNADTEKHDTWIDYMVDNPDILEDYMADYALVMREL